MQASSGFQGRSAGLGLALVSAFAFGGSGVAAKPLIEAGLDPLHVVWLRVAGAAVIMLPVAWRHRNLVRERPALLAGFGLFAVAACPGLLLRLHLPYPRRCGAPGGIPGARAGPRLGPLRAAQARHPGRRGRRGAGGGRSGVCRRGLVRAQVRPARPAARPRGGLLPGRLLRPLRPRRAGRPGRRGQARRTSAPRRCHRVRTDRRRGRPHRRRPPLGHGLVAARRQRRR